MKRRQLALVAAALQAAACSSVGDTGDGPPDASQDTSSVSNDGGVKPGKDATVPIKDTGTDAPIDATLHDTGIDASDAGTTADVQPDVRVPLDLTFYVVADTHADPVPESDLHAHAAIINSVSQGGQWPTHIDNTPTNFVGGAIAPPRGVVFVGDLTGWGTAPTEIPMYKNYFVMGTSSESINYPTYLGFGNHDVSTADRDPATADAYRATYWQWVDSQHRGPNAPVPVTSFDPGSHNYSWDWDGVHFIQTHRFAGDSEYGLTSSVGFVANDLHQYASDGRPVFLFHHYAMDAFGTNGQWWTDADRTTYRNTLTGYGVAGIFAGHTHYAMQYTWQGLRVFQVNNAKAEINTGNNDGNGSFAIVRITDQQLDIVTCRWTDAQGHYELIAPFFSGPANPGRAP